MIIYDTSKKILFKSSDKTLKKTVEEAVRLGVSLRNADLRRARLRNASLDGLHAKGVCLWGADLTGADIGLADLRGSDLRMCDLKDTCLAETDLSGCDLRGAYFSNTIFEGAVLENCIVSCPSIWECDVKAAEPFARLTYSHQGEIDLTLQDVPLIVGGLTRKLVMMGGTCLWGNRLYDAEKLSPDLERDLFRLRSTVDKILMGANSFSAMKPIPKIAQRSGRD